jgi:hypothetical protein
MVITLGRINQHQQLQRVEKVVNVSFPEDWVEHYMSHNYISCDPILRSVMGQGPIHWADKFSRAKGQQEKQFIQELNSIGMGNGVSFSALSERQNLVCVLSVSGSEIGKDSQLTEMLNSLLLHAAGSRPRGQPGTGGTGHHAAVPARVRHFPLDEPWQDQLGNRHHSGHQRTDGEIPRGQHHPQAQCQQPDPCHRDWPATGPDHGCWCDMSIWQDGRNTPYSQ